MNRAVRRIIYEHGEYCIDKLQDIKSRSKLKYDLSLDDYDIWEICRTITEELGVEIDCGSLPEEATVADLESMVRKF